MNVFKKIISFFILILIGIGSFSSVNANQEELLAKQVIVAKYNLEKTLTGKRYAQKIDTIVAKLESEKNLETLNMLLERLNSLATVDTSDARSRLVKDLVEYLKIKIIFAIYNVENSLPELSIEEIFQNTLSDSEKQKVEEEIVNLQLNLFGKASSLLERLTDEFERLNNYEDNGDFSASLNVDHENIGEIDYGFGFSDYSIKNSNFDSELKGKIDAIIKASTSGENIDLEVSAFIDFISKDGNMYLLLEKLNIVNEEGQEFVDYMLENIKKLEVDNKYIKFENQDAARALSILNSLTPSKIITNGRDILSESMLEPYAKEGDKYLLKPTKYACDKLKELSNKFDPFYGNTNCSDGQYEDMLRGLNDLGTMYIILGEEKQLGFYGKESGTDFMGFIIYNDDRIQELNLNVVPDQSKYPDEGFEVSYRTNDSLYIKLFAEKGDIDYEFSSTLDSNNRFKSIDFTGSTYSKYSDFSMNLKLENRKITGNYEVNSSRYNWETSEYSKYSNISGNISGNTLSNNELSNLSISLRGVKTEDNSEFIKANLSYNLGKVNFSLLTTNTYSIFDMDLGYTWNSTDKVISAIDLQANLQVKDYYSEDDDYKEVFDTDIVLNSKIISGKTMISSPEEKLATITHSGKYEKGFLELNNFVELEKNPFDEESLEKVSGNLNFGFDVRDNKNNLNIYLDAFSGIKKIIEFSLENSSTRTYKDIEIQAPTNTIDYEEVFGNSYDY